MPLGRGLQLSVMSPEITACRKARTGATTLTRVTKHGQVGHSGQDDTEFAKWRYFWQCVQNLYRCGIPPCYTERVTFAMVSYPTRLVLTRCSLLSLRSFLYLSDGIVDHKPDSRTFLLDIDVPTMLRPQHGHGQIGEDHSFAPETLRQVALSWLRRRSWIPVSPPIYCRSRNHCLVEADVRPNDWAIPMTGLFWAGV